MTSYRPYRQALSYEEAFAELRRCAGTQFDPDLVERYALEALWSDPGDYRYVEPFAHYVTRAGRAEGFLEEVEALLEEDLEEAALGRLVRARKVLRGR